MTFVVGDYRATESIGGGGAAQVWRGVTVDDGAGVVIKVFPPDQLEVARREAALAAEVDHPHVVAVVEVVGDTERAALITAFAAGGNLSDLLARRGRLSAGETLTVLLPLAAVLAAAHEREVTHGDISAQNVVFDRVGRPLLAALGAAQAGSEFGRPVAATPVDAAPELARGGPPTPATDMFSLGSVALACLTGRHAWPADDLRDVVIQAAAGRWPDPGDDTGPPGLIAAVRALLEHDPDRRPTAASLVKALASAGRPEPVVLRPADTRPDEVGREPPAVVDGTLGSEPTGGSSVDPHSTTAGASQRPAPTQTRPGLPRIGHPAVGRPRAGGASGALGAARLPGSAVRFALVTLTCVVVAGLAVSAGLWWASWDRSAPVAAPAVVGSSGRSVGGSVVRSAASSPAPSSSASGAKSAAARSSASFATSPAMPSRVSGGATRSSNTAPTGPARQATLPTRAAPPPPVDRTTSSSVGVIADSSSTAVDWAQTVRSLDAARARAFLARRVVLLDAVYTADSTARTADARAIATLLSGGLRVSGAAHLVREAYALGASPIRVLVDDSLPSYSVLDRNGTVVGQTRSRATAGRILILVRTSAGYRISRVESA